MSIRPKMRNFISMLCWEVQGSLCIQEAVSFLDKRLLYVEQSTLNTEQLVHCRSPWPNLQYSIQGNYRQWYARYIFMNDKPILDKFYTIKNNKMFIIDNKHQKKPAVHKTGFIQ